MAKSKKINIQDALERVQAHLHGALNNIRSRYEYRTNYSDPNKIQNSLISIDTLLTGPTLPDFSGISRQTIFESWRENHRPRRLYLSFAENRVHVIAELSEALTIENTTLLEVSLGTIPSEKNIDYKIWEYYQLLSPEQANRFAQFNEIRNNYWSGSVHVCSINLSFTLDQSVVPVVDPHVDNKTIKTRRQPIEIKESPVAVHKSLLENIDYPINLTSWEEVRRLAFAAVTSHYFVLQINKSMAANND